jgi:hypothetical protein
LNLVVSQVLKLMHLQGATIPAFWCQNSKPMHNDVPSNDTTESYIIFGDLSFSTKNQDDNDISLSGRLQ